MGYFRPLSQTKFINDANLVSYWKLDGNSNDSKGSNNGTDTNISYAAGKFDSAAGFNGNSSKITITNTILGSTATNYTISAWINTANDTTLKTIMSDRYGASNYDYKYRFYVEATTKVLKHIISNTGNTKLTQITSSGAIPATTWTHVTVTITVGGTCYLYINGKQDGSASYTADSYPSAANQSTIGVITGPATEGYFNGSIDDVAVFSRALSSGEVADLYQSMTLGEYIGAGSGVTKLLMHLNGSSADSSGNGNNGVDTAITYSFANGKLGQGAGFNGTSSKINLGNVIPFDYNTAFTMSCWIKNNAVTSGKNIIKKQQSTGDFKGYGLETGTNGNLKFFIYNGGSGKGGIQVEFPSTYGDKLYHAVVTYSGNGDASGVSIYIDGSPVTKNVVQNFSFTSSITSTANFSIGTINNGTGDWSGNLDEVIIENVAWSAEKIKKYYTMTKGRFGII